MPKHGGSQSYEGLRKSKIADGIKYCVDNCVDIPMEWVEEYNSYVKKML